MHPEPFRRGTREFMAYYGTVIESLEMQYVNGFAYTTMRPAPEDEIPQRFARAEQVWERKVWREQLREWDDTAKPAAVRTHRELQSVDVDALSDEGLVAYLTRCREHHSQMINQHMRFSGSAMLPVGDLLAHLGSWTGVTPASALAMMRGAAPVSAGASGELERLIAAIRQDPAARALLDSDGEPGKTLSDLRGFGGEVGTATSEYLDLVGCRLLDGFDISGRYALELPDALLRAIRSSVDGVDGGTADADALIADIRLQVPDQHRAQFDELVGEARLMYRLRDERGVFSDIWESGIMRRAALAAGRRLQGKGRVHDAEHFIDADFGEMCSLAAGTGGPSADELARRLADRTSPPPSRLRRRSGHHHHHRRLTRLASRRAPPESCTPWASRWPSCPAARRRRMRRTCCAVWPPVAVYTKGRPGASRARQSSIASCRATCSSPNRRPRRSTSCCRCSARSSPTPAVCSRTRLSWRVSTASLAWSGRVTRPTSPGDVHAEPDQ
jgi:hypothetical protein